MNAKFNHLIKDRKHIPRKKLGVYLRAGEQSSPAHVAAMDDALTSDKEFYTSSKALRGMMSRDATAGRIDYDLYMQRTVRLVRSRARELDFEAERPDTLAVSKLMVDYWLDEIELGNIIY